MKQNKRLYTCLSIILTLLGIGCSPQTIETYQQRSEDAPIFPDYAHIVLPPNIAPLHFTVNTPHEKIQIEWSGKKGEKIVRQGKKALTLPEKVWRDLLQANQGDSLFLDIYLKEKGIWYRYPRISNFIASEPIDSYLTYRLIEPGYRYWKEMGIYQRNLENFDEKPIYRNDFSSLEYENKQCMNCHSVQNHRNNRFLFHLRSGKGGTLIYDHGKYSKYDLKTDSTLSGGVYPAWHPQLNLIVFSTNKTTQAFHTLPPQKVEVFDTYSDLIAYDVETNKVQPIFRTDSVLETFPTWSPDGKYLYYCATSNLPSYTEEEKHNDNARLNYKQVHYHLLRMAFDSSSRTFGAIDTLIRIHQTQASISFPRVSPDGNFVMFTASDYGTFPIWHTSSNLFVLNLKEKRMYPLKKANSTQADSYHSWSSNGRWFVFSSRRIDGQYTRTFIAYFDKNGQASKAFLLPQYAPETNDQNNKAYNIPELTIDANPTSFKEWEKWSKKESTKAIYAQPDATITP